MSVTMTGHQIYIVEYLEISSDFVQVNLNICFS